MFTLASYRLVAVGQTMKVVAVRKMKKINTEMVYKQKKYGLLNEMSEGFCKFLTLLPLHSEKKLETVSLNPFYLLHGNFDIDPQVLAAFLIPE